MKETFTEEEVGAVVVATGYDLYTMQALGEYGGEKYEDVVNGLEFERILSASGPTGGDIRRASDGKVPKSKLEGKGVKMKLFNTMTGKKEDFRPLTRGRVGIYACGVTVYDIVI